MKRAALIFFFAVVGFVVGLLAALLISTFQEQPRPGARAEEVMASGLFWLEIICPVMGLLGAVAGGFIASRRLKK